jgi:hypothetical protein
MSCSSPPPVPRDARRGRTVTLRGWEVPGSPGRTKAPPLDGSGGNGQDVGMTDASIHHQITELVAQEHQLRAALAAGGSDEDRAALRQVEESLDQCWDLLRQRDARRDAGENPDEAKARPVSEVEGYLQ